MISGILGTELIQFLCRSFGRMGALLVLLAVFASPFLSWGQEIAFEDPHREWLGPQYAETLVARMRTKHPELDLRIEIEDISDFAIVRGLYSGSRNAFSELRYPEGKISLKHRLMDFARNILPGAYSDFLRALEGGYPIQLRQNTLSGAHDELRKWIESQPDNTLTPDQLMEQALLVTRGRVIAAWVLAWNVVRDGWAAAGTRNYGFIQKFVSLTGERHLWRGSFSYVFVPPEERLTGEATLYENRKAVGSVQSPRLFKMVVTKRGDDFSYLYHRIGVELLAMVVAKHTGNPSLGKAAGSLGAFGEWFKFRQAAGLQKENSKRLSNDLTAAASGARLYQLIEGKVQFQITEELLSVNHYLRSNSKKYNDKYVLPDGRPASYFGSNADPKFWASTMSVEELKYRFYHATHYDSLIFNPVILAGGEDYDRLHRGLYQYMQSPEQSPELNQYIADYLRGVRALPKKLDVSQDFDLDPRSGGQHGNEDFARQVDPDFDFNQFEKRLKDLLTRVLVEKKSQAASRDFSFKGQAVRCEKVHRQ